MVAVDALPVGEETPYRYVLLQMLEERRPRPSASGPAEDLIADVSSGDVGAEGD